MQFDFHHFPLSALLLTLMTLVPIAFLFFKKLIYYLLILKMYLDYSSFPPLIPSCSTPFMFKTKTIILKLNKAKQQKEKNPKEGMRIRDPFVHIQDCNKTIKLDAIIYMRRTWCSLCRSVHTASGFLSLHEIC